MLNIILTKPRDAFTEYKIQGTGAQVASSANVYKLKEFCPNSEFDNGISPWGWITGNDFAENPSNQAQTVYNQAYSGRGSASVVFNTNAEWFGVNLSSSTNRGADIANRSITISAYIKTNSSNLSLRFYIPDIIDQSVPIASTSWQWALRTATINVPDISEQDKIFVGIVCSGTASFYVDLFSVTSPSVVSDIVDYTYLVLNPGWNLPVLINAASYDNFYVYFITGANQKILAPIRSIGVSGGVITRIDLYDVLPYGVSAGTLISVLLRENQYASSDTYTICDKLLSCETETAIDTGYSSAQISLFKTDIYSVLGHTDILMWRATINCEYGEIFDGIVTAIEEDEEKCNLTISGFSFFLANQNYVGYFPSSSDVTTRVVLLNMLRSVPVLQAQNPIVDRDNAISSVQSTLGGIGPLDFSDGNFSVKDCIDKILKLGTYDNSFDALFLQIYSGRVPILKRIPREVALQHIQYFADHNNLQTKSSSRSVNITDFKTAHYAVYNASQGEQAETSLVGDSKFLNRYGLLVKNISSGNLTQEEAYLILQNMIYETELSNSIGSIDLVGTLGYYGGGPGIHVSQVRAGDIIMFNGNFYEFSDRTSLSKGHSVIVVGNTRYDAFAQIMSITPYRHQTNIESMLSLLEVE